MAQCGKPLFLGCAYRGQELHCRSSEKCRYQYPAATDPLEEPARSHLSRDEQRQAAWKELLDDLTDAWRKRLHLVDWTIDYALADVVDGDPSVSGSCEVFRQLGHRARITLADRVLEGEARYREETVVHEHVHILFDELCEFAEMYLPRKQRKYFRRLLEMTVSDVGDIVIELAREGEKKNGNASE